MQKMLNILFGFLFLILLATGCQDLPPDVYDPKTYVEGYLIVDRPIEDIKVMMTQPVLDSFNYEKSIIRDADVFIKYKNQKLKLSIDPTGERGYYYSDTNIKVLPEIKYNLEIILKDGTTITASTVTPKVFNWVEQPPMELQFPTDTIDFKDATDTIRIKWEKNTNVLYYFIRITCIDTALYGKYMIPPTVDSNRRVYKPFARRESPRFKSTTLWGFVPSNSTPVVWSYFKWYGMHRLSILSPDYNFMRYSIQYFRENQYNPLFSNIQNGIGCFGSASEIDAYSFVLFPKK